MDNKRKALGRGLGALIPNLTKPAAQDPGPAADRAAPEGLARPETSHHQPPPSIQGAEGGGPVHQAAPAPPERPREYFLCPIEEIAPSADNPRQRFDEDRMEELSDSIRTQGLVQPLVVRLKNPAHPHGVPGGGPSFVLIAGERRWRAAQKAGLKDVPVVVKDVSAARAFELALVENLQREDLNAIEEAEAYRRLSEEFGYTQEQLAQRVGRARETVANALRLLKLPDGVRQMVVREELTMGHARALLALDVEEAIVRVAHRVIDKKLSVRQTEELIRRERQGEGEKEPKKPTEKTPAVRDLEERLQKSLGTRVRVQVKDDKAGRIEIDYHSLDQLDDLIKRFMPDAETE